MKALSKFELCWKIRFFGEMGSRCATLCFREHYIIFIIHAVCIGVFTYYVELLRKMEIYTANPLRLTLP